MSEYEEYEDHEDDGYDSEEEEYPEPAPPDYSFPTCAFYSPPASVIEAGEGALPTTWPYDRALPYAACINRMVVGEELGTCRCANQTMPSCHGYQAEAPVVLETWADPDDITVDLTRERRGLGEPVFIAAGRPLAAEAEARSAYTDLRLDRGATRQLRPEQARFLAELIRA